MIYRAVRAVILLEKMRFALTLAALTVVAAEQDANPRPIIGIFGQPSTSR